MKRYIGIDEMAEYLDVAKGTLYVWVCHKQIPYTKMGRLIKFDLQEIEDWLKDKQVRIVE